MDENKQANIGAKDSRVNPSKKIVLVTGGSGLIGSKLIAALQDHYQIVGLDKIFSPNPFLKVENVC